MQKLAHFAKRRVVPSLSEGMRRWFLRAYWEMRWRHADLEAPWLDRTVSAEIVEAVDRGWFPAGSAAVDLGCGNGDVAAFLAARGFGALGVDIAPSAIARAREKHPEQAGRLEFVAADVCTWQPGRQFDVLVDRGCFHQLPARDHASYVRTLEGIAAPGARLLLFVKAFREDSAASSSIKESVELVFSEAFELERVAETSLDDSGTLGGLAFWLSARARPSPA